MPFSEATLSVNSVTDGDYSWVAADAHIYSVGALTLLLIIPHQRVVHTPLWLCQAHNRA